MGMFEAGQRSANIKREGKVEPLPKDQGANPQGVDHWAEHHAHQAEHHEAKAEHHANLAAAHTEIADHHRREAEYHRGRG